LFELDRWQTSCGGPSAGDFALLALLESEVRVSVAAAVLLADRRFFYTSYSASKRLTNALLRM
jgi:hypothetical protein